MAEPVTLPAQDLPPIEDLLAIAQVDSSQLIDLAVAQGWTWNPDEGIYTDGDGNAVEMAALVAFVLAYVGNADTELQALTTTLLDDGNLPKWESDVALLLALLLLALFALGRGTPMTEDDYNHVQERLTTQLGFLRGFSEAILAGVLSEEAIRARLTLYAQDDRLGFWEGWDVAHSPDDWPYYRNLLNAAENCPGCIEETGKGWVERGGLTPIGGRDCRWNCRCEYEYARELPAQNAMPRYGWVGGYPRAANPAHAMPDTAAQTHQYASLDELAKLAQAQLLNQLSSYNTEHLLALFSQVAHLKQDSSLAKALNLAAADRTLNQVPPGMPMPKMGTPTPEQMALINTYLPEPGNPEDWFTFEAIASDNLISYSRRRWHPNVLNQMADRVRGYLGKPWVPDHEWEAQHAFAFTYAAALETAPDAPAGIADIAGYGDYNRAIIAGEGYRYLHLWGAVPRRMEEHVSAFLQGLYHDVSTGGLLYRPRWICPDCSQEMGREVTFTETDEYGEMVCPHWVAWDLGDTGPKYASYAIVDGLYNSTEVSVCVEGNLPGAGVMR